MTSASGKQPYDIFISYRTTHADWVETLAHNLKAQGYAIFLDRWELIPGQHFPGADLPGTAQLTLRHPGGVSGCFRLRLGTAGAAVDDYPAE